MKTIFRMVARTQAGGGNAIISLIFDTGDLGGHAQVCAYGTVTIV